MFLSPCRVELELCTQPFRQPIAAMSTLAKFSLTEYEHMVASGVFEGVKRRRIELVRGELREMNPIGSSHADLVDRLMYWSVDNTDRRHIVVRIQQPVTLAALESEPEPDVVWAVAKKYRAAHPTAADVRLLIEVAYESLRYDRTEKAELYAQAGIGEYWIVDVEARAVKTHRDAQGSAYRTGQTFGAGQSVCPLAAPAVELNVDWLFDGSA